jgi:uncharacterized protein YecT (DUF1311 family)
MRYQVLLLIPLLSAVVCGSVRAQEKDRSEYDELYSQSKAIGAANAVLDGVYQRILASLDGKITSGDAQANNVKVKLIAAERAWIKWRDAEAQFRAYEGGAVGGSAYLEDLHQNLMNLIEERRKFLEQCSKELATN